MDFGLPGFEGAATSPTFAPDGARAAFLQMKAPGYEADQNDIVIIMDVKDSMSAVSALAKDDGHKRWDRSAAVRTPRPGILFMLTYICRQYASVVMGTHCTVMLKTKAMAACILSPLLLNLVIYYHEN